MRAAVLALVATAAIGALPSSEEWEPPGYTISTFECYVDNFAFDQRIFSIRVFTNNSTYVAGGPILFYTGGEGPIETFIENAGNLPVIASALNALLVFAEHRYFGESLPFGAESFSTADNAKYLSPHQALADYANLVRFLKLEFTGAPVIAVGGSYGGMLAAWFRIKYPHLVDGALASSAPLFHFINTVYPEQFNQIVASDYATCGSFCPQSIYSGFKYLSDHSNDPNLYHDIREIFQTCKPIMGYADVQSLIDYLKEAFVNMAITNFPYPTNDLNPLPADPVCVACDVMALVRDSGDMTEILTQMSAAAGVYYNYTGTLQCNDFDSSEGPNGRSYLACSTLVMPMAQEGMPNDIFPPQPWNYTEYARDCQQTYGRYPQPSYAQVYYGTSAWPYLSLRYISRIIFSSGSLDPWQSGAVLAQPAGTTIRFTGAHSLDLREPNPADPQSVIDARTLELNTLLLCVPNLTRISA